MKEFKKENLNVLRKENNDNTEIDKKENIKVIEEKTNFEKIIIETFKQSNPIDCFINLNIALEEVNSYINEIKESKGTKTLINKNLLDKFNRIFERNFFYVNILIGKIFNAFLDSSNYNILSSDFVLLISFLNLVLNILEFIQGTNISIDLEIKCFSFLNFLTSNQNFILEEEQEESIKELISSFQIKKNSDSFQNFPYRKKIIIRFCNENNEENKLNGILQLIEYFSQTYSLNEQYDMLINHCSDIFKSIINKPNVDYSKVYFELGNFFLNLFFNYKYILKFDSSKKNYVSTFLYLSDLISNEEKLLSNIKVNNYSNDINQLSFLNEVLFEETNQKEIMLKYENIFPISLLVLNTLIIYENEFDLQFICYLILRRIYFIFPQFRKETEDLLASSLINLCKFQSKEERKNIIECKQLLNYLLKEGNDTLKGKINHRLESKGKNLNIELEKNEITDNSLIEYDVLNLYDFNLKTGYPLYTRIEAGSKFFKYIEVENKNSIVYIGYSIEYYNIDFHLLKYCANINQELNDDDNLNDNFVEIVKFERSGETPVKIILFVKEPGIYKIIFDNSFSWFTQKEVKYRINILKSISEINFHNIDNH
jgi:hypothetical protein